MFETVFYFHRYGVAHKDLFPRNVILPTCSQHPVFIDFGFSTALDDPCLSASESISSDARQVYTLVTKFASNRARATWLENFALTRADDPLWTDFLLRMRDPSQPQGDKWIPFNEHWWKHVDEKDKDEVVRFRENEQPAVHDGVVFIGASPNIQLQIASVKQN